MGVCVGASSLFSYFTGSCVIELAMLIQNGGLFQWTPQQSEA